MSDKKEKRLRRAARARHQIRRRGGYRLSVFRSPRHIYAQIITEPEGEVKVSASTLERELRDQVGNGGNTDAAKAVGARIAKKAADAGIKTVAFDRAGFKYHGRIKALADAAREGGLEF
jgi:large subunit ribosomal protein L18